MAVRFEGTSAGVKGTTYTVQVHDTDHVGSVTDVDLAGDGFTLKYNPNEERPDAEIIDSSVEFSMIRDANTKTAIDSFISDLITAPDERFTLRILDASNNLYWCGYVLADQVRYEDDRYADTIANVRINAKDGLNRLKAIDYNDAGSPYTGRVTFKEHLFNVLDQTGLQGFWSATDDYLLSIVRWYEAQDTTATLSVNEMDRTYVDHLAFIKYDDDGDELYIDCYEVLRNICAIWGARIYLANGSWHFEQWNEYRNTGSIYQHRYYKDRSKPGTATGVDLEVDESANNFITAASGLFSYLPAVRKVDIEIEHLEDRNYFRGLSWDDSTLAKSVFVSGAGRFRIAGNLRTRALFDVASTPLPDLVDVHVPIYAIVDFLISYDADGTTYYLSREANILYSTVSYQTSEWTTSSNARYKVATPLQSLPEFVSVAIDFITPAVPDDVNFGEFTFDISYDISLRADGSSFDPADYPVVEEFTFDNITMQVMKDDGSFPSYSTTARTVNPDNSNASEILEKELFIADRYDLLGSRNISILVSGSHEPTGEWTKGLTGSGSSIQKLLSVELLNQRRYALKVLDAAIYCESAIHYSNVLKLTTAEQFVPMQARYNSKAEVWQGQYTFIGYSDSLSSFTTVDEPLTPGPGGAGGGAAPGEGPQTVPGTSADNPIGSSFSNGGHVVSTTGTSSYNDGDAVTTIGIETMNVDGLVQAGDTIAMIDRTTGNTQTFTVTTDVAAGDTSISISSATIDGQFSQNSFITLATDEYIANIRQGGVQRFVQTFNSSSATLTITENGGDLPNDTNFIDVFYGTGMLTETDDYTISGSDVVLTFTPKISVKIVVKFWVFG